MPLLPKHYAKQRDMLRDVRPASERLKEYWTKTESYSYLVLALALMVVTWEDYMILCDIVALFIWWYTRWILKQPITLPFKLPKYADPIKDPHNPPPGKPGAGKAEGILYLGNLDDVENPDHSRELWLTNSDARTHVLFLGTTGSGKTEGLKAIVTNSLTWGSGFVYVDGKADTDLWASLFALARRFGRDDDLLILNYMTANSDDGAMSNTMNPFANGSASYLTNMVTSLMPDAGGDNAMWKERAVALLGALMPALTWKREHGGMLLDVSVMREYIELPAIIRLSRDANLPERIVKGLQGYLNTLPGYIDAAFDDEGNERPPAPDQPMYDLQVARQQHGYLSMQFTRSLQSLADEYGYIFKAQLADVDILDVVLNRRILVGLIPSLEKSGEEAANLGKIVAASLKGMMGATLGNTVEGSWENAIGSKQTRSASSFMTVFDEVGYYTAPGMAVMAAQARSLGFSMVFAAQDLPSMEKRVKQEAQSILANCNLKIFGKLEDPLDTKKFFQEHVGTGWVLETGGMEARTDTISSLFMNKPFYDKLGTGGFLTRVRADYDHLRNQREGEVHMLFSEFIVRARMFYSAPDKVSALRVHKFLPIPGTTNLTIAREKQISEVAARLKDPDWTAASAGSTSSAPAEIAGLTEFMQKSDKAGLAPLDAAMAAVGGLPTVVTAKPASRGAMSSSAAAPAAAAREAPSENDKVAATSSLSWGGEKGGPPVTMKVASKPVKVALEDEAVEPVYESKVETPRGFVPQEIDTRVVPALGGKDDAFDLEKIALPEGMTDVLQNMASKLNKGLGGEDKHAE